MSAVTGALSGLLSGPTPQAPPRQSPVRRNLALLLGLAVVLALAGRVIELRPLELARDVGNIGVFLKGYLRPSFAHVGEYAWQCLVTVCIALWGTVRAAMDVLRAVNEFVFALMFVTAVGLGPFAGMLALGLHTGGVLGKLLSETIESIDPGQVEGVSAAGATRLQTIAFGVVPQVLPNFISYVLLRFESDIRSASVIGMIGGGGIGFYLWDTIRGFRERE